MTDQISEEFGNLPNPSATVGTVPQDAEGFGNLPQAAETFRTMRNAAERTEQHTLTVREVVRLFEVAGVPRTERSIINWCQPNHQGVARLGAFYDTNERKYFITPQGVTAAIREEQAKAAASGGAVHPPPPTDVPNTSERPVAGSADTDAVKRSNSNSGIWKSPIGRKITSSTNSKPSGKDSKPSVRITSSALSRRAGKSARCVLKSSSSAQPRKPARTNFRTVRKRA